MLDAGKKHIPLAGMGPVFITGQPDRIGPGGNECFATAQICDRVPHLDLSPFHGLLRTDHVAGHKIRKRQWFHIHGSGKNIVAIIGPFVHLAVSIGKHKDENLSPEPQRHLHRV